MFDIAQLRRDVVGGIVSYISKAALHGVQFVGTSLVNIGKNII